jgi:hypothetical protein
MGGSYVAKETDARWMGLTPDLIRASEIPTPIPLGHFLRQFGQSDRREIDAFNREPNSTHSLTLMNGPITALVLADKSRLRRYLSRFSDMHQKVDAVFQAILLRSPDAEEREQSLGIWAGSMRPEEDLIWALLNSPEFLFIQ